MKETPDSGVERPSSGVPTEPESLEDIVERWWENHFPGSPVAQVTQAWNHAFAAKEELKRRLIDLVKGVL
jgi:hypothetical protein